MREAMFYEKGEKGEKGKTFCRLCPKLCSIRDGKAGFCRVRKNEGGKLYSLNYGECAAIAIDPVEKKPLYHFYPKHNILSLGTFGCNLHCGFCQNWRIAHEMPRTNYLSPENVVELATRHKEGDMCIGVAYTYSEPFMWYEFVFETARLLKGKGLKNVLVTNGYVNPEPLKELLPYIDAMNIDVKGFTNQFYQSNCAGMLEPVMRTVEISSLQCHVELTTLLVTGLNDSDAEIEKLVDWVASISPGIPLHFSRYFPNYKMDVKPTPLERLQQARDIAMKKLDYVYIGNAPELNGANTICPHCDNVVIKRTVYNTDFSALNDNRCVHCGIAINLKS